MGFLRSSDAALMARVGVTLPTPDSIEDTTTGPEAPDLEVVHTPMAWLDHTRGAYPQGHHFGLHTLLLRYVLRHPTLVSCTQGALQANRYRDRQAAIQGTVRPAIG